MLHLTVVLCLAGLVASHPTGVPTSVCVNMTPGGPGHGNAKPQSPPVPFQFTLNTTTTHDYVPVEFTIHSEDSKTFAGFMVQARDESSSTPTKAVGTFHPKGNSPAKTMKCYAEDVSYYIVQRLALLFFKCTVFIIIVYIPLNLQA